MNKCDKAIATESMHYLPYVSTQHISYSVDYLSLRDDRFIPATHIQAAGVNGTGEQGMASDLNLINENYYI
ncbi:MAG: hypothetical protein RL675_1244 [Bacteroidota bacterium]